MRAAAQSRLPWRRDKLDPFVPKGYLDLVASAQVEGLTDLFRDHDSSGTINGSSHTIKRTRQRRRSGKIQNAHTSPKLRRSKLSPREIWLAARE